MGSPSRAQRDVGAAAAGRVESPTRRQGDLRAALDRAEERRAALLTDLDSRRATLPLRYWLQQAHYTVPADDGAMVGKALRDGTAPMARLMERFGVATSDLAARLGIDPDAVEALLATPRLAPLVMLDGEDAQAPGEEAAENAIHNVVHNLTNRGPSRHAKAARPLRFFRPPGVSDPGGLRILVRLLYALGEGSAPLQPVLPLDGIVVPKVRHPEEIELVDLTLADAERELGLAAGSVRLALLVESGWAVAQLPELARRAAPRLCALIYGPVDHAADVGLPAISPEHPVALAARSWIVEVAGAIGVPAIDGMTLAYPVADPLLDRAANRERFLERVARVFDEARAARALGMLGKWVGHPAQLFAALLAFDEAFAADRIAREAARLEAYRESAASGRGATVIEGEMSDRATDRHARAFLRQALAAGRLEPARALELGVIAPDELAEARALRGGGDS